ncbi:MAG: sulfate transporter, inner rane subunit [Actinomycetia bacterium]|nr:sulfate transporter, inner rane subunit [Actinomycetes bacterium]
MTTKTKWALRLVALLYLALLLIVPVGLIFWRTFQHGFSPFWHSITTHEALHALRVTLEVAITATVLNTVFGITASLLIVRHAFPGKRLLNALIDLPLAVSPVVAGLALILIYGRLTPIGGWLGHQGVNVIFALPGMVIATVFVSLPLVVRELVPVLEEIGTEQEQAAWTLGASAPQTFRRITLPAIRWALAYGIVLALARSLGEFGAVAVVSGKVVGQTQTLTLYVEQQYQNFDKTGAYAVSVMLAMIAIVTLIAMTLFRPKER